MLISIGFICVSNTGVGLQAGMNRNTDSKTHKGVGLEGETLKVKLRNAKAN